MCEPATCLARTVSLVARRGCGSWNTGWPRSGVEAVAIRSDLWGEQASTFLQKRWQLDPSNNPDAFYCAIYHRDHAEGVIRVVLYP